jgi:hypothetical protein
MTVSLTPTPRFQWATSAGPAVGYKLYTYVAGTSTPQATYVDSTQTTQNTNPIILDSYGSASVWLVLGQTYKLILQDQNGNPVYSQDQIVGTGYTAATIGALLYPILTAEGATVVNIQYPYGNVVRYGADPTGVTDSSTALTAAIAMSMASNSNAVVTAFPGTYKFLSQVSVTLANSTTSLSILGFGAEQTQFNWPSGGGLVINYLGPFNTVHIRNIAFLTGVVGAGTQHGVTLNQTALTISNPALSALSDISDCVFRGSDGYGQSFYWEACLNIVSVSNVNVTNCVFCGANAAGTLGIGIAMTGTATAIAVVCNVTDSTFLDLAAGFDYLSNAQGVNISESNLTGVLYGVQCPAPATNCNELTVVNCQFACPNIGIYSQAALPNIGIANNLFLIGQIANGTGVELAAAENTTITGNTFGAVSPTYAATARGVSIDSSTAGNAPSTVINSNVFQGLGQGVSLGSTAQGIAIQGNAITGATTAINITAGASNLQIEGNLGYNPVGILGPGTVGASPATITNGSSPATYYFSQSATNTATVKLGTNVIGTMSTATTVIAVNLGPNEACIVTWTTTAPTYIESVH